MARKTKIPKREDIIRQLAQMAFGRVNDCVALVLEENVALDRLDLTLLAGVKRNKDGSVEVRMVDRLQALRELAELQDRCGSGAEDFLRAIGRENDGT